MVLDMDDALAGYLAPLTAFRVETKAWHDAPLHVTCYLTEASPPLRNVSSARAIVIHQEKVLVIQDPDRNHIMPGGRLEPDESIEDALRREVLEETGWTLSSVLQIGVLHFAHTGPKPDGWLHPYPDFLQVVHAAHPDQHHPDLEQADEYVLGSNFTSIDSVRRLPLDLGQHVFLEAALKATALRFQSR